MADDPALFATLAAVGKVMAEARDPWWIIASAAVALHGADAGRVADVDVLLGITDARRILPTIGIRPRPGSAHPIFRSSVFGTWCGATPLPVEFMADFSRRAADGWLLVRPVTRQRVQVAGVSLFVPDRKELRSMLIACGRAKDLERAATLASPSERCGCPAPG